MTQLARLSLLNRSLVALLTVLVAVFGVVSLTSLRQELIPSLEIPTVAVVAATPGLAPDVVAEQVTGPLEDSVAGVEGLESTSSTSSSGVATVLVQLEYGTDLTNAQTELQSAVSALGTQLPEGTTTTVVAGSIDALPVLQLSATSDAAPDVLAEGLRSEVVPALAEVDGVREAAVSGAPTEQVQIDADPAALAAAGLSPADVAGALQGNGVVVPAGTVDDADRTLSVAVGTAVADLETLRDLPLLPSTPAAAATGGAGTSGALTRLGDVASVTTAEAPTTSVSRTDGRASLSLSITKTPDGNTVEVSEGVLELLPELEQALGEGTELTVVFDQAPFIEQSVEDLTTEGLLGLGFAVVVILLFLLSVRSTLVTALSIPLSLLVTFVGLWVGGYTLNILTLGALTVAIGRVVDDSIVVIENIKRHLSYGEEKRTAILTAVREVAGAVTASTLTTVAVFLPIALVGGQVGELFRPFALTVTLALLASLLVSLTIVPVLASWFLKGPVGDVDPEQVRAQAEETESRGRLQRGYLPVLRATLAHPWRTVAGALVLLVGTGALVPLLQTNFLGDTGQNSLTVTQELEPGASLRARDDAARDVEDALAGVDGVESVQTTIGGGEGIAAFTGAGGAATFSVTTDPDADQVELEADVREQLEDQPGTVSVTAGAGAGFGGGTVDVVLTGADAAELEVASDALVEELTDAEGVAEVTSNLAVSQPVVQVQVDRSAAALVGLTETQVGQTIAGLVSPTPLGTLTLDEDDTASTEGTERTGGSAGSALDVVLTTGEAPADLEALRATVLPTATGPVPLEQIATVEQVDVPTSITRQDGARSVTVSATPQGDDLGAVTTAVTTAVDDTDLPAGVEATVGGASADQSEAFSQLGLAVVIAIAIVYVLMVATFRSLLQPLILLVSVPFAATGAVGLLLLTGTPLGVASLIGLLMLVGIVVTNAIVLIDLVNQYRAAGHTPLDAVVDGARQRLRPILMTAAATVLALTPMALGLTGGSAFISQPLAVVVIGGLVTSTLLTLVLVPVLYLQLEQARARRGAGTPQPHAPRGAHAAP